MAKVIEKKKTGRPKIWEGQKYEDAKLEILERIATGETLSAIGKDEHLPSVEETLRWVIRDAVFGRDYARARDAAYERMADEILEIADDSGGDYYIDERGKIQVNHENVQRARLMVDTRKWVLSKRAPNRFGDKIEVNNTGEIGLKIEQVKRVIVDSAKVIEQDLKEFKQLPGK